MMTELTITKGKVANNKLEIPALLDKVIAVIDNLLESDRPRNIVVDVVA